MSVWSVIVAFAVFYVINAFFSFRQAKNLSVNYVELRRQGKVVMGKYKRLLNSGAIIMFGIDDNHLITDARSLTGVTVFSRFKKRQQFSGMSMELVGLEDWSKEPKNVRKAIENASDNYHKFIKGEEITEPDGPWARLGNKFSRTKVTKEL